MKKQVLLLAINLLVVLPSVGQHFQKRINPSPIADWIDPYPENPYPLKAVYSHCINTPKSNEPDTWYSYDEQQRVKRIEQVSKGQVHTYAEYRYNPAGQLQQVTDYSTTSSAPVQGQWVEYCYNAQGQLQAMLYYQAKQPLTQKDSLFYEHNQLVGSAKYYYRDGKWQRDSYYEYEYEGDKLVKATDYAQNGHSTEYEFRYRRARLVAVVGYRSGGSTAISYHYDQDGQLVAIQLTDTQYEAYDWQGGRLLSKREVNKSQAHHYDPGNVDPGFSVCNTIETYQY